MGKSIIAVVAEELDKEAVFFRAMPNEFEYINQQAAAYRTKEAYFEHIFRTLRTRGYIIAKPMTRDLANLIQADITEQLNGGK
jgi:hypothetical protein